MDVRGLLYDTLQHLGYEIGLQGSYSAENLPADLITYTIADTNDTKHYDNMPAITGWDLQVNFYSTDMDNVKTVPDHISAALMAAGFTRRGKGYDTGLDKETGLYGWLMDFYYIERN